MANDQTINITYISHVNKDQLFGQQVHLFSKAVAKDLKINLSIQIPKKNLNRYEYLKFAKKVFARNIKPDFIIAIFYRTISEEILKLSHKYKIPVFIVNTNIPIDDKYAVGKPRTKYKNFLGTLASNETKAGYDLAKYMINKVKQKTPNKSIKIVGIAGPREATEAIERNKGLLKAVNSDDSVILHQILYTNWSQQTAYKMATRITQRYGNDINIIWAASDSMSIAIKKALIENKRIDILTGGIDLSKNGIKSVKNNMNGGFALILLYDYYHGKDFVNELGSEIKLDMFLLSNENIDKYLYKFSNENWDKIDFRKYSKTLNPNLLNYDFSINSLFNNLK